MLTIWRNKNESSKVARKKPYKIDPPTKTVTIPDVPSVIANEFKQLLSDRTEGTELSYADLFREIVLNERRKDVGDDEMELSMRRYNEIQERKKQFNEFLIEKAQIKDP